MPENDIKKETQKEETPQLNIAETKEEEREVLGFDTNTPSDALKKYYNPFIIDNSKKRIRIIPSFRSFLKLSPSFYVSGVLKADPTQTTIIGTDSPKVLNSFTIPPNTISRNDSNVDLAGNVLRITATGVFTTDDATAVCNLAFKVGDTTFHTLGNGSVISSDWAWKAEWLIITAESTWSSFLTLHTKNASGGLSGIYDSVSSHTIDTTKEQILSIVATWASGSAGDSLTIRQFLVELLN